MVLMRDVKDFVPRLVPEAARGVSCVVMTDVESTGGLVVTAAGS